MRIPVVEDQAKIAGFIQSGLEEAGFAVEVIRIQKSGDFVTEKVKANRFIPSMESKVYPAKIDWWLWLILVGCSLGLVVWGGFSWDSNRTEAMILIGAGIFNGILFSALLFPCYYAVEESNILIRSGILRYRVPIDGVQSVTPTWNPLSAPAPSLKRVEIRMKNGKFHLVSPADREGFIEEINHRAGIATPHPD